VNPVGLARGSRIGKRVAVDNKAVPSIVSAADGRAPPTLGIARHRVNYAVDVDLY
jgi:hypothetical protein